MVNYLHYPRSLCESTLKCRGSFICKEAAERFALLAGHILALNNDPDGWMIDNGSMWAGGESPVQCKRCWADFIGYATIRACSSPASIIATKASETRPLTFRAVIMPFKCCCYVFHKFLSFGQSAQRFALPAAGCSGRYFCKHGRLQGDNVGRLTLKAVRCKRCWAAVIIANDFDNIHFDVTDAPINPVVLG